MNNRKFLSIFAKILALTMLISLVYIVASSGQKKVSHYKIDDNSYYSGIIKDNKLEGEGEIISPKGSFVGTFKNGRFDGPGEFKADDFTYRAKFNKNTGNDDIEIDLDNETYLKIKDRWQKKAKKNEN